MLEPILQTIRDVEGVQGAMVIDRASTIIAQRAHAIYDLQVLQQVAHSVITVVDSVQLVQDDWDVLTSHYSDGKLLLRNLRINGAKPRRYVLTVIADTRLNVAFLGVALRVAAGKLVTELEAGPPAIMPAASTQQLVAAPRSSPFRASASPRGDAPPPPPPRNGAAKKLSDMGVVSGVLPSPAPPAPIAGAANGSRPVSRAIIPTPAMRAPRSPHSPLPAPLPTPQAMPALSPQTSASTPVEEVVTRQRPAVITRPRHLAAEGSTRDKPSGGEAVFAGQLEEFPLADLLVFMRNGVRTGLLTCITEQGAGSVQLVRGLITGADSPAAGTLRDHLLARPGLTASQRLELTVLPHESFLDDDAIEQALLPRGLVSVDELAEARETRVFAAFREMVNWTTGRFSFEPSAPPAREPAIEMSAQSVLLQIFREQDEQSR